MDVKAALIRGLTSNPKYIPVWYRYDKHGSVYNDDCLEKNKHYYLHKSEMEVLTQHIKDIIAKTPENCSLVDFGSGNSEKTRIFIDSLLQKQNTLTYVPVDISEDFIREVCSSLSIEYGNKLTISPVYGDYDKGIGCLREMHDNKLIVWFGSLQNLAYDEQVRKLQSMSNNVSGYSAKLYYNSILRLNRDFGSEFEQTQFELIGNFYKNSNPDGASRFEVRLRSRDDQTIKIPGLAITLYLKEGECINLHEGEGVSCKYTQEQIRCLMNKGNLQITHRWISRNNHVMFVLLSKI